MWINEDDGSKTITSHPELGLANFSADELEALDEFLHATVQSQDEWSKFLRSACAKVCDARDERVIGAEFWFANKVGQWDADE